MRFWRRTAVGIVIPVRLTPRSSADSIDGLERQGERTYLKARVRAVPEKGKANAALEKLAAKFLGVPRTRVSIDTGGKSRLKAVAIEGNVADLEARLRDALAARG